MRSAEVPRHGLTDEELNSLSEEERKAVLDGEDDGDDQNAAPADDDGKEDDDQPPPAGDGTAPADEDDSDEPFAVGYDYDPSQFNEQKAREDLEALDKQFQEGEIDLDVYNKTRDGIRDQLQTHRIKAELSVDINRQVAIAKWNAITETFMDTPKNAEFYKNRSRLAALDSEVRRIASDKANSNKSETWIIREADRLVREAFTGTQPQAPRDPQAGRRPPEPPQTLGGLPPAAPNNDETEGEFAHLDDLLDGTAEGQRRFERAIAKLTPEQQARYAG